jgi:hypothetical protein
MSERICSIEDCDKPAFARGWCSMHYSRWLKHGDPSVRRHKHDGNRVDLSERKHCLECNVEFGPRPGRAHAQWESQQFCSRRCKNAHAAHKQKPRLETQRRWANAWEHWRWLEDLADIRAAPKIRRPTCRLIERPMPRQFIGGVCRACGATWIYYAKRAQSPYCVECNQAHHRRPANRRARQNGALYEVIVPRRVFERDGWRCQICKRKTRGKFPNPRAATVDHIVPLAKGGGHTYLNVQCACFECNCLKQDGSANDQLRLCA